MALNKKILICHNINVPILNPNCYETKTTAIVDEKIIIFKSNVRNIIANLKSKVIIDNELYIGCEMGNWSNYGTNGTFGNDKLFECINHTGVLIPLAEIMDCCVNGSHAELKFDDGTIIGSSICCVKVLEQLNDLRVGERVFGNCGDKNLFGTCRWIGLVNNMEAIGIEMAQCDDTRHDECIEKLALFDCQSEKRALFLSKSFLPDNVGYRRCLTNGVLMIDANNISSVSNGKPMLKTINFSIENDSFTIDIKWRGVVNRVACVGFELTESCVCGTDGVFGEHALFKCGLQKGTLIPCKELLGSCEQEGKHKAIIKYNSGSINVSSICCEESVEKMSKWPNMKIGSRIKYKSGSFSISKIGECKWMGLINGIEYISVGMKQYLNHGTFTSRDDRELLFMSDDIEHDLDGEKLHFTSDKLVDIDKIWTIDDLNIADVHWGIKIGDYVSTYLNSKGVMIEFRGVLEWVGMINGSKCVGINLDDAYQYGMNGMINDVCIFKCPKLHGVITTTNNIKQIADGACLPFTEDGLIDPTKYLKCEEEWNEKYLHEQNICKDKFVFVIIEHDSGGQLKRKGLLKWCGKMNDVVAAVVELCDTHQNGTDGTFWKHQLIKCGSNRAVAAPLRNIFEYKPYHRVIIPQQSRIVQDIYIDSAVLCLIGETGPYYTGIVKWSGIDENDAYLYGVEFDDECRSGSDGIFDEQRLFDCKERHGALIPIKHALLDPRYVGMKQQYTTRYIPEDKRIFKELDIDSPVKYKPGVDDLEPVYGTLKWSGVNDDDEYFYGLVLDENNEEFLNDLMNEERLSIRRLNKVIIVPIAIVVPDSRFRTPHTFTAEEDSALKTKTKYFESVVIDPRSVIVVNSQAREKLDINDNVEFKLGVSGKVFYGSLLWMGEINTIAAAVVCIDNIQQNESLHKFLCSEAIKARMNLTDIRQMVIVLLAFVFTAHIDNFYRQLVRSIKDVDISSNILIDTIAHCDVKVSKDIVTDWKHSIDLERYPGLLRKLMDQHNYSVLAALMNHFITSANDDDHLLFCAKYFLMNGDNDTFLSSVEKCKDTNILLKTGETFLTMLIKDCDDDGIINRAIGRNMFDVNKANIDGESPLVLACKKLMKSTVLLLMSQGALASSNNNMALDALMELKNNEQLKTIVDIVDLISKDIRLDCNVCQICLDRKVDTSFVCGHNCCYYCSNQIENCHVCKQDINDRRHVYLNG